MSISFDMQGKVAVVTGGVVVLCAGMYKALAEAGAKVAVLDLRLGPADAIRWVLDLNAIYAPPNKVRGT